MNRIVLTLAAGMLLTSAAMAQSAPQSQQTNIAKTTTDSVNQSTPAEQRAVKENLKDVHFAFDSYELDDQDRQIVQESANWLKANPEVTVSIAGNADERGDITYNLALSHKRAEATRDALVSDGVSADRIEFATGWGKLYPICNQSDENCWSENRRAHMTAGTALQTETVAQVLLTSPVAQVGEVLPK